MFFTVRVALAYRRVVSGETGGDRASGGQVWVAGSGVVGMGGGAGGVGGAGLCICYSVTIRLILQ